MAEALEAAAATRRHDETRAELDAWRGRLEAQHAEVVAGEQAAKESRGEVPQHMAGCLAGGYVILVLKSSFISTSVGLADVQVPLHLSLFFCHSFAPLFSISFLYFSLSSFLASSTASFIYQVSFLTILLVLPPFLSP